MSSAWLAWMAAPRQRPDAAHIVGSTRLDLGFVHITIEVHGSFDRDEVTTLFMYVEHRGMRRLWTLCLPLRHADRQRRFYEDGDFIIDLESYGRDQPTPPTLAETEKESEDLDGCG